MDDGMKFIFIFFLHFLADFVLQNREMAKNKSSNFKVLFHHLMIHFFILGMGTLCFLSWESALKFAGMNAIIHGLIDWNIWRFYKRWAYRKISKLSWKPSAEVYAYWEDHTFYLTIGLDQFLHTATLIILWNALK